jgi:hypothetical protein
LLRNKKAYLNGRRPGTACMAEKIACGYFFPLAGAGAFENFLLTFF